MAYSKQNFQNGQILNAANLEKMENGIIAGQGVHNLLDNSWWKKPREIVNQRGATSKQGDWVYWIDRWLINATNAAVRLRDGGIYLPATVDANLRILQRIPIETIDNGKAYTLAICESNGTIRCMSGVYNNNYTGGDVIGDGSMCISIQPGEETYVYFIIDCYKNFTIRWAALYEGSYDASTLPAYQPKGYAAELAECQRYYQQYNGNEMSAVGNSDGGNTYIRCPLQVPMRIVPSLVQSSVEMQTTYSGTTNKAEVFTFYASNPQCVQLRCTSSIGSAYQLVIATNNVAMAFSADL